jgi:4-aminobutyrate aminotransferase-like enzyme
VKTEETLELLRAYESRNVTFMEADRSWPIVWERARGVHIWDADGRRYLDLTAAFGVAAAGHCNARVVRAGQRQMGRLLHAMGDVHPHALKAQLARELSRLTFERWSGEQVSTPKRAGKAATLGKTIFCNSGFEAVEAALKTAMLATGKPGVIAFEGAYHGVGYGALNATHRAHFREPFRQQLREFGHFAPFPSAGEGGPEPDLELLETRLERLFKTRKIGAILVEPVQVRGGLHIPPLEFLPLLRRVCDRHAVVLILDEIYTGFGRTGKWFATEHSEGVVPDLLCVGKALTGGFPLSACIGRADLMDTAWPASSGEAIHTSTFLGHPVGCAMALAQLKEIASRKLVERSLELGRFLLSSISALNRRDSKLIVSSRGIGLLVGVELRRGDDQPATECAVRVLKALLHRGYVFLPEGADANVLGFTPPLTITKAQLADAVAAVRDALTNSIG